MDIEMVDLKGQYLKIHDEINAAVLNELNETNFINGPSVKKFSNCLSEFLDNSIIIPCANGTDALQIAIMALGLNPGDEVIVPAFTYVATAEVIGLLGLKPIMIDVDIHSFNIDVALIEKEITNKTKLIVPVHLYGQCANMEPILNLAKKYNLYVIEDTAQALGAEYTFSDGNKMKAGTIGDIGCVSFFPSKNLGCFGDGGALITRNPILGEKIKMIANHGQVEKYIHKYIGVNSRLDSIQAAILNVKLKYLNEFNQVRGMAANLYDSLLSKITQIGLPERVNYSNHVFHQYTIRVKNGSRDKLKSFLTDNHIPSMVYYPIPLYKQEAFKNLIPKKILLANTENLCKEVLSLPMHTELTAEQQIYITSKIEEFFK